MLSSLCKPAPTGYEPFYISHYGRHGSRWMTADERYTEVICVFDSLYQCSELTPLGVDVRERLHKVWEDARGCSGSITPLGERQHREIAERMYHNFPQVFRGDAFIDTRLIHFPALCHEYELFHRTPERTESWPASKP